ELRAGRFRIWSCVIESAAVPAIRAASIVAIVLGLRRLLERGSRPAIAISALEFSLGRSLHGGLRSTLAFTAIEPALGRGLHGGLRRRATVAPVEAAPLRRTILMTQFGLGPLLDLRRHTGLAHLVGMTLTPAAAVWRIGQNRST